GDELKFAYDIVTHFGSLWLFYWGHSTPGSFILSRPIALRVNPARWGIRLPIDEPGMDKRARNFEQ
ncbi:MAG TPA: hypothetical protein VKT75_16395, partial [Acidobacteriaceae bacterium]|nr:hypothetical protein [Acidobacteriaceae bacterium]